MSGGGLRAPLVEAPSESAFRPPAPSTPPDLGCHMSRGSAAHACRPAAGCPAARPTLSGREPRRRNLGVMRFTAAVTHEGDWQVARCLEVEVASQGHTVEEALANLREALELYFEDETIPEGL